MKQTWPVARLALYGTVFDLRGLIIEASSVSRFLQYAESALHNRVNGSASQGCLERLTVLSLKDLNSSAVFYKIE